MDIEADPCTDIKEIVTKCLKQVKKIHGERVREHPIKMLTQLTAVMQYVEERPKYQAPSNRCKRPCLTASLVVARRMGKGVYFARQIREHERYLLRHHWLPPSKRGNKHSQVSLLDNENVIHIVRKYLAEQKLGTISPLKLSQHVKDTILPGLGITGDGISERGAVRWLRKLGYRCKDAKKGIYVDGHERPDVVVSRGIFLAQMEQYERCANSCIEPQSSQSCSTGEW